MGAMVELRPASIGSPASIGIVGSGYIAKGLIQALDAHLDLRVSRVLTRRDPATCSDFPAAEQLTNSIDELLDHSDLIVECSGDVIHATVVVDRALAAGLPVVTMNSEFHVTTGSYFVDKGVLTEAEGDQPGCLAALREDVLAMGFTPLVYGNVKGFHHPDPALEDMEFWSRKQGISLPMVISATDGTKMQFEQAFVANSFHAAIARPGMVGLVTDDLSQAARSLAEKAVEIGEPISDYIVSASQPARVFIVATHDQRQREALNYLKLGPGPFYLLTHNTTLCHLEIAKTIKRVLATGQPLMNNSATPSVSMAAIAKRALRPGDVIANGCGGFDLRGMAITTRSAPDHVPIGLIHGATVARAVEPGQMLSWPDLELPDSLARDIVLQLRTSVREVA